VDRQRLPARRSPPRRNRLDRRFMRFAALSSSPRRHRAPAWHHPWRWRYSWNSGATFGQSGGGKRGGPTHFHGGRRVSRTDGLVSTSWHTLPAHLNYVIARSAWKLHGGLLPQIRLAQPIGLRPPAGAWPAGPRVVPERWAGARDPLPAPASGLAAAALLVHCRRAARPPSLLTIGPEGARLSALSLPDPHPALARAGVILAAAAARRPPACHGPQRGADNPGRRRRRRRSRHC